MLPEPLVGLTDGSGAGGDVRVGVDPRGGEVSLGGAGGVYRLGGLPAAGDDAWGAAVCRSDPVPPYLLEPPSPVPPLPGMR